MEWAIWLKAMLSAHSLSCLLIAYWHTVIVIKGLKNILALTRLLGVIHLGVTLAGDKRTCENVFDRHTRRHLSALHPFRKRNPPPPRPRSPFTLCCCVSDPGGDPIFEITHNVTAVLGEDVHLVCAYRGDSEISGAEWTRRINSKRKSKGLAGFENGIPYGRNGFSAPGSMTNLTVRMEVLSVDAEGEYVCEFETEEEYFSNSVFLSVVGKSTSLLMAPGICLELHF